jgi:hypothetical protein
MCRLLVIMVIFGVGCASESSPRPSDMAMGPACVDPPDQQPDGGVCVSTVSGKLVDDKGAPLPDIVVSVCAAACYYGKSAADGSFKVTITSHLVLDEFTLLLHGRPNYACYYRKLPPLMGNTISFTTPITMLPLPASGPAIAMNGSAQTITDGDLTLSLSAGTTVTIDFEDVTTGAVGSELRVLKVDPTLLPLFSTPPDALYLASPFDSRFSQPAALTFANSTGLPAGASVDVQLMGGLDSGTIPAGNFTSAATAHVSADGKTITTDPGQGVLGLTAIALRKN